MEAVLGELRRDPEGVLPADGDEGVDAEVLEVALDLLDAALDLDRVRPGGAQDGAAPREDAAHRRDVEWHGQTLERALPSVAEAHEVVAVVRHAPADHRADDRVQSRAVAAAGEHSNAHDPFSFDDWPLVGAPAHDRSRL
ncbi:unannotated protein [freshwater metagenome]|uniref:Unannotated protein n=1 Tax=freshwater metagenome TaxID=449393 RepID=A0A6J7LLV1_9ZZZZ